jgi:uroporphyrinogen decarboxylase
MDLATALEKVPEEVVLCGNLDPVRVFVQLPPEEVQDRAAKLMAVAGRRKNFVLSSGCDVPPNAPLGSLDAFYRALN